MNKKRFQVVWLILLLSTTTFAQQKIKSNLITNNIKSNKMKIEIWSDIMCPFCYIGKRKLEAAMEKFEHKDEVEIVWKSFQLDPTIQYTPNKDVYSYLAERKGLSVEQSKSMHVGVTERAKEAGLTYNFDKAVINNSFNAHRVIQFAKTKNLGDAMEEKLFKAYFTDGKNMGDFETLATLANEIGLDKAEVLDVLNTGKFATEVNNDIREANQLEINGVPFFVMDRKYAVSGAQDTEVFLRTLEKSYKDWIKNNPKTKFETTEGAVCTPAGECK